MYQKLALGIFVFQEEIIMKLKNLVFVAVMCALAVVFTLVCRIPVFTFLTYDPKDVVIVMIGFMLGPLWALVSAFVTALVELLIIGDTGLIGFFMNFIGSAAYSVTAGIVYKKMHTRKGAFVSLVLGTLVMTVFMILWNYLVTPFYMGVERSEVVKLLVPVFLPFNVFKGIANSIITMLIYKPLVRALRKGNVL